MGRGTKRGCRAAKRSWSETASFQNNQWEATRGEGYGEPGEDQARADEAKYESKYDRDYDLGEEVGVSVIIPSRDVRRQPRATTRS